MFFTTLTFLVFTAVNCEANKLLLIVESAQSNLNGKFVEQFGVLQKTSGIVVDAEVIVFSRKLSEDVYKSISFAIFKFKSTFFFYNEF